MASFPLVVFPSQHFLVALDSNILIPHRSQTSISMHSWRDSSVSGERPLLGAGRKAGWKQSFMLSPLGVKTLEGRMFKKPDISETTSVVSTVSLQGLLNTITVT